MFRRFLRGNTESTQSDLVEIRPATTEKRDAPNGFAIPRSPVRHETSTSRDPPEEFRLKSNLPSDGIYFFGRGEEIDLGIGKLQNPLVYGTNAAVHGRFDASLIDASLPLASVPDTNEDRLPYWPSYYDCSPAQRRKYLEWLLSGRQDPEVEFGFVFIYFYGLERRVLVDRTDFMPVISEVMRLLMVYGKSNSFRRYGSSLLWMTIYLAFRGGDLPLKPLVNAIKITTSWTDETLGICLGILKSKSILLPVRLARTIAERDARSSSSVIVSRHREEFNKLFKLKYQERWGKGIQLDASKHPKRVDYFPASGSLLRNIHAADNQPIPPRPDVLGKLAQFKPLVAIWEECIESLRSFSRANRKAAGEVTAEVYETLPPELRIGEHPEEQAWLAAWEANVDQDDWPIVPVSDLAAIKNISPRDRLTKSQCNQLLATADAIGLGIEPDARITGKNYRWDERVTLFFHDGVILDDPTGYAAASVLLRLGASIAEADGTVDEGELGFINEHLQGQFNLSDAESKRLDRLQYLLLHSRSGDNSIGKALAKKLSLKHRRLVGEFLVGVAASDEVICKAEVKALRKAYRSLELEESELDQLIQRHEDAKTSTDVEKPEELHLDLDAVSKIMAETQQVATLLRAAMADEDEADDSELASAVDTPTGSLQLVSNVAVDAESIGSVDGDMIDRLDERYRPLLKSMLTEDEWSPADLRKLADEHGLMLGGAIEAINEWSTEYFGDWIIEEGDSFLVHKQLLQETN